MRRFIFIGAKPDFSKYHPGGQSTAAHGLIDFCKCHGIVLDIIDSAQENFPPPTLVQRVLRGCKRVSELATLTKQIHYDGAIIFSSDGLSFYEKSLLALICRMRGIEVALSIRSGYFMETVRRSVFARFVTKRLLGIPNHIVAQGAFWRDLFLGLGLEESRIHVIHNWISPETTVAKIPKKLVVDRESRIRFVFVGWLVQGKGVLDILDAISNSALLRESSFVFAGDGDARKLMESRLKSEGLQNVKLLGWQTREQVDNLLDGSDVFVLPTYAEGFPNSLLEALCKGMPAIVTPVGGIPDSAQDGRNAIWVSPGDCESLRLAMEKFVRNPGLIKEYSRESLKVVSELHDRETNCNRLFGVFSHNIVNT